MSYAKSKAKYAQEKSTDHDEKHSRFCHANGCPMPGSVSTGGYFFCSYHSKADSSQWGFVTESLKEAKDIIFVLDELLKIDVISWASQINGYPPKWMEFDQLFSDRPDLKPQSEEQQKKSKYEYRLRNYLGELTGTYGKARTLQVPKAPPTVPFNEMHNEHEIF